MSRGDFVDGRRADRYDSDAVAGVFAVEAGANPRPMDLDGVKGVAGSVLAVDPAFPEAHLRRPRRRIGVLAKHYGADRRVVNELEVVRIDGVLGDHLWGGPRPSRSTSGSPARMSGTSVIRRGGRARPRPLGLPRTARGRRRRARCRWSCCVRLRGRSGPVGPDSAGLRRGCGRFVLAHSTPTRGMGTESRRPPRIPRTRDWRRGCWQCASKTLTVPSRPRKQTRSRPK